MIQTIHALRNTVVILLVILLQTQTGFAQVDPWERVKLIEPGKQVQIKLSSGKTINGKMEAWRPDGLSLRQAKDKVLSVKKSDVAQVALTTGMSRGRRAAYAGLIGGAAGGGLMGAACASSGCGLMPARVAVAGSALLFGGVAAGIAALFPQHKEVLYTAGGSR